MTTGAQPHSRQNFGAYFKNTSLKLLIRWVVLASIITYLLYNLSAIGWSDIWQSLPTSPLFYILSIAFFLIPTIAETAAFRRITAHKIDVPWKVFVRKHVLNKAVLTYSGEAYLVQQLSRREGLPLKSGAIIIKDLALIRTFSSNLWIMILIATALALGNSAILQDIITASPILFMAVSAICLTVCFSAIIFFQKLTSLAYGVCAKAAGIFLLRSVIVASILTLQWSLAIPGTPLSIWFLFLVVYSLTRKSPVGGELVFVSVVLALPGLNADSASVAAMLMTIMALNQINYITAFILTSDVPAFKWRSNGLQSQSELSSHAFNS